MRGGLLLFLHLASCGSVAAPRDVPSEAADEPAPQIAAPSVSSAPARIEGYLDHAVCIGSVLARDPPHEAACCYPAMELIKRPIRAAFPRLRACYEARKNPDATGRVSFFFRIETDGSVARVCAEEASAMYDVPALECMVEAIREVRFPAGGQADRDMCGLISLHYPVVFKQ